MRTDIKPPAAGLRVDVLIGQHAFQVDWCAELVLDENGDSDMGSADYRCETFATKNAADRRAKAVLPRDAFGSVSVTPVEFVPYDEADAARFPHVGFWEPIGDPVRFD